MMLVKKAFFSIFLFFGKTINLDIMFGCLFDRKE